MTIPTTVITGHLGAGKTSVIRHLLGERPGDEKWAVIVNEFGELGIDGARLERDDDGLLLEEITGACICCGMGSPLLFVLEKLLARTTFDRLLIEPTGLAEPTAITDTFAAPALRGKLQRRALIGLVDVRTAARDKWRAHATAQRQLHASEVLVGTFADEATDAEKAAFTAFSRNLEPPRIETMLIADGALPRRLLDTVPLRSIQKSTGSADHNAQSWGGRFPSTTVFDRGALTSALVSVPELLRAKGFVRTPYGFKRFDVDGGGTFRWRTIPATPESRVEIIASKTTDLTEAIAAIEAATQDHP